MSIITKSKGIISTLVAMLQTRLDLLIVELEEELLRFSSYFIYAFVALFCGGMAVFFLLVLILVLCWEEHRVEALVCFIVLLSVVCGFVFSWLKDQILNKPHLLEKSIAEFKKDIDLLRFHESESDQQTGREL